MHEAVQGCAVSTTQAPLIWYAFLLALMAWMCGSVARDSAGGKLPHDRYAIYSCGTLAAIMLALALIALGTFIAQLLSLGEPHGESNRGAFNVRPAYEAFIANAPQANGQVDDGNASRRGGIKDGESYQKALFLTRVPWEKVENLLLLNRNEPSVLTGPQHRQVLSCSTGNHVECSDTPLLLFPKSFHERLPRTPLVDEGRSDQHRMHAHVDKEKAKRRIVSGSALDRWRRVDQKAIRRHVKIRSLGKLSLFPCRVCLPANKAHLHVRENSEESRPHGDHPVGDGRPVPPYWMKNQVKHISRIHFQSLRSLGPRAGFTAGRARHA